MQIEAINLVYATLLPILIGMVGGTVIIELLFRIRNEIATNIERGLGVSASQESTGQGLLGATEDALQRLRSTPVRRYNRRITRDGPEF